MKTLDIIHRWTGAVIGLLLAVIGLSGALLVHKDLWLRSTLPAATQSYAPDRLATAITRLAAEPGLRSIVLPGDGLALHTLRIGDGGGYADQSGAIIARWASAADRPETWLFDLHHHLLIGETGETITGILGLIGLGFIVTGAILWWRTRRTFRLRALPQRLTVSAIRRHHRDLGIVLAPLLILLTVTGAMMTLKPVAALLLSPLSSPAAMAAAAAPPAIKGGALAAYPDWPAMLAAAHRRFPDAELRIIALPRRPGDLITIRMKQSAEWLPNGRTSLWFDPATGALVAARDALTLPAGARAFNLAYPLHAAKVGGIVYRLAITFTGLGLTLLGLLATASFWTNRLSFPSRLAGEGDSAHLR